MHKVENLIPCLVTYAAVQIIFHPRVKHENFTEHWNGIHRILDLIRCKLKTNAEFSNSIFGSDKVLGNVPKPVNEKKEMSKCGNIL